MRCRRPANTHRWRSAALLATKSASDGSTLARSTMLPMSSIQTKSCCHVQRSTDNTWCNDDIGPLTDAKENLPLLPSKQHTSCNMGRPTVRVTYACTNADIGAVSKGIAGSVLFKARVIVSDLLLLSLRLYTLPTARRTALRWPAEKAMMPEPKADAGMRPDLAYCLATLPRLFRMRKRAARRWT